MVFNSQNERKPRLKFLDLPLYSVTLCIAYITGEGKCLCVVKLKPIHENVTGGVLSLTDSVSYLGVGHTVRDILLDKHPSGQPADPSILLPDMPSPVNSIIFEDLTHESIRRATLRTQGAAGMSGLDAATWRHMCSSFGNSSQSLCTALAAVGKRLCTVDVHPLAVSAFVAGRLIPLISVLGLDRLVWVSFQEGSLLRLSWALLEQILP